VDEDELPYQLAGHHVELQEQQQRLIQQERLSSKLMWWVWFIMAHPAIAFGAWLGFSCRAGIRSIHDGAVAGARVLIHPVHHHAGWDMVHLMCVCAHLLSRLVVTT
jgi:hypothetical protein